MVSPISTRTGLVSGWREQPLVEALEPRSGVHRIAFDNVLGALSAAAVMLACLVVRLQSEIPMDAVERLVVDIEHEPLEI